MAWLIAQLMMFYVTLLHLNSTPDLDGDDDADEDEETEPVELDGKLYKNPQAKIEALESEKTRHAINAKKARAERDAAVEELEALKGASTAESLASVRMESAFYKALFARDEKIDADTTWDLLHTKSFADLVTVADDGNVSGMDAALDKLFDRYPWLLDGFVAVDDDEDEEPKRRTAPPPKKRRDLAGQGQSQKQLAERFPSLKSGRKPR